jgi:hypothetical protein
MDPVHEDAQESSVVAVSNNALAENEDGDSETKNGGDNGKTFWSKGMITAVVCGSVALIVGVIVFLARCNSSDSKMGSRMEDSDSDEERAPALASGAGPTSGQSNPRSGSQ